MKAALQASVVSGLLLASSTASACAVCGGRGQNQQAFLDTMVFMSLMPLIGLGTVVGVFWYLARKAQAAEAATQAAVVTQSSEA